VINYEPVDATPLILAGLLAILGLGVLAQFAFQSARFRRRDFAVLRTLGLQRRQLSALIFWQLTTVTLVALLIGLPVGVAAGHWAWALFANVLGISPGTDIPIGTGLLLIPAVLLAANAVGLWPARGSTRVRPAQLLRTE
jgi:predicted lysophospholipase L1 biosynthesis ABC-type transport system permease subunit